MNQLHTKRNLRWTLIFLLVVPGICCSGCLTTLLVSKNVAAVRLQEKLEKLAAQGIPIDNDSLDRLHRTGSSTEFANDWVNIHETFKSPRFLETARTLPVVGTSDSLPAIDQPWVEQPAVEAMLADFRETVDRLLELSQRNSPVAFPIKMDGFSTLLPHAQDTRQLARVLVLECNVAARAGDAQREFRAINGMLGCSISVRGQPFMISQLVAVAIHRMAISQLQSAVEADRLTAEQLKELDERLDQFSDFQATYQLSLKAEMSMGALACRNPDSAFSPGFAQWNVALRQTGLADRAAYLYLEQMESALEIQTEDLQEFTKQIAAFEPSQMVAGQSNFVFDAAIAQQALPAISAYGTAISEHAMVNRLAKLGIAIRLFEKSHSSLPTTLEELAPLGIVLEQSKTSSGELPKYIVNSADTGPRAVLWSFSLRERDSAGQPMSNVSPIPPSKATFIGKQSDVPWWIWEFSK